MYSVFNAHHTFSPDILTLVFAFLPQEIIHLTTLQQLWQNLGFYGQRSVIAALIILIGYLTGRMVNNGMRRYARRKTEELELEVATRLRFLRHLLNVLLYAAVIIAVIYQFPQLRGFAWSLTAGAGVFAAILGFASQQAFSNIISGLVIVYFKPFRVNDRIKVGETIYGDVEDINLRHTVVRNFENQRIIVPNSVISKETIINASITDQRTVRFIDFVISYDSDADHAIALMRSEIESHPLWIDARTPMEVTTGAPKTYIKVVGFEDSGVKIRAYAWAATPVNAWELGTDINLNIKKRFRREGIEIPYPYRTLVFKQPGTHPSELFPSAKKQDVPPSEDIHSPPPQS